ncbi:MAG: hypothetical protein C5B59_10510 [Bacteroidetes bacterium]|nr:MAG: hypothetical protein C5B59_10510 [Bacteroidota bacterium]
MKLLQKYFGHIFFPIVWTVIILILLALPGSMVPSEQGFSVPQFDKIVHICLFGGFVLLWNLYYSKKDISPRKKLRIFFTVFIIGAVYGIGMEYVQKYFIPKRDFDQGDIIADLVGASLAYGICNVTLLGI